MLGALWIFAAFGGWGRQAFCTADGSCADNVAAAVVVSLAPAALALLTALTGWAFRAVRDDPDRLDTVLSVAAVLWLLADAVVFIGGWLARGA